MSSAALMAQGARTVVKVQIVGTQDSSAPKVVNVQEGPVKCLKLKSKIAQLSSPPRSVDVYTNTLFVIKFIYAKHFS